MNKHKQNILPHDITPSGALDQLKQGNFRFLNNLNLNRNLLKQVNETKDGQWPFAAILSCMDSRTSSELIFDQGLGDIFSIRIAGNVITGGILGSLEYATAVAGSRLILVLGHTHCGAIKGACDGVRIGNLTGLLERVQPAIIAEDKTVEGRNSGNIGFVNAVARLNVLNTVKNIGAQSPIISGLVNQGALAIVPAMYDVATGKVTFYEDEPMPGEQKAKHMPIQSAQALL